MPWNDEWSGLADFLANMIEKYMQLSALARKAA